MIYQILSNHMEQNVKSRLQMIKRNIKYIWDEQNETATLYMNGL